MTPAQYRKAISRLGLSQVEAGKFFKVSDRQSRRWASGDSPIPFSVELSLWFLEKFKIKPDHIRGAKG